jgi:hypothetical protein
MILIPTVIRRSQISGFGCFAATDVAIGTPVWKQSILNTFIINKDSIIGVDLQFLRIYGYKISGDSLAITIDNSSFMNHSDKPNLDPGDMKYMNSVGDMLIANRNIKNGDELLVDYRLFDIRKHHFTGR